MSDTLGVGPTGQSLGLAPRPLRVRVRDDARDWRASLRRAVERSGIRTPGWALLGLILLSAVLGGILGWWELRLLAVAGVVVAAGAALFLLGRPQLDVHVQLPARRVSVGDDAAAAVHVRNAGQRRGRAGARLELPVGAEVVAVRVPGLTPGEVHRADLSLPTERRAVVPVGPARSVQGDPFGLAGLPTDWTGVVEVFVHPRTVALPGRQAGFIHDLEGHATDRTTSSDMSFHALREYVPGDDRRHVHWRSTARTGRLMVRQYEETRQSRMAVGLDCGARSYTDDEEFELAVSVAASFAQQAIREGNPLAVLAGGEPLVAGPGLGALDELCRVAIDPKGSLGQTVTAVTAHEADASIIAVVTGSSTSMVALRRACAGFGVDARVLGIRVATGATAGVRASANVSVLQVGDLADLPRLARSLA